MNSCRTFKTGKLAARHDPRTLKFRSYLEQLPPTPLTADWTTAVPNWEMLGNDVVGDCTIASAAHLIMMWTALSGTPIIPSTADVLAVYTAITGYNPADPNSDQGANELDVLNYWRNNGVLGHKISAFVSVEPSRLDHVRAAINLFGGVYAGVLLPDNAMTAFDNGQPWSDVSQPAFDGHAIPLCGFDENGFTAITWSRKQYITNAWAAKYLDEAFAPLSPDWMLPSGDAPSGFDEAQLTTDLSLITG